MDLCNLRIKRGEHVILKGEDCLELEILEKKGFIVTSDMPDNVAIHILCHMKTMDGDDFFCVKQGIHD
jgi:hypothetical protein